MADFSTLNQAMRGVFRSGRTKSVEWRRAQLMALLKLLDDNRERICQALKEDLNKSKMEGLLFEVDFARNDLINCINNLNEWTKPEKVKKGLINMMDKVYIRKEPFGVALIMGAWNYPIQLTICPMIGAIAAGNCVLVKPSEISASTAALLEEIVPKYLDKEAIQVVNGGIPETTAILKEKWDYIFYTGNSMVGKIVMRAAAEHLTPVTLELGGKSPVYVDDGVDLGIVANRIMWGKCTNAGQTCIAPDYVMCSKKTQDALIDHIKKTLGDFYPDGPAKSPDYCRLVSDRHYQRIKKNLQGGGTVAVGGGTNDGERYVAPTVLTDVKFSDPIMQDEIFGPILPIIPVENEDIAIEYINDGEKPLAFYVFSKNPSLSEKMQHHVSSGGFVTNDVLMHAGVPTLPFGGVGSSGMGAYHGKFSYETFCHKRSCMERELKMEALNGMRYPPYTETKMKRAEWFLKRKVNNGSGAKSLLPYFLFGTLFAVLLKLYMKTF
ncbi:aldehyde dehydrogenase family 3 member B1-like isoform X3 [Dreissena polymorpha]|uniref:aldehyde dehydrogenase family 3 member B1-like isoform X3 n=1 Tax=Dreissena polymorpha TaxID=45954 RepID=UPI002264AA7C|nr:aldehyde dehydrogenase family 3 member B1-like isoform X3 [Dreissena polymorpha]XP_052232293.1 aldehyde dehydrogenase family 3 member B1-like isoform X3 [Dreissena polymorpha]XP_052232298.1 aldehyde dehydrogenase family 3 member B1-like isoform X3 [Dreissena polymorpha]